MKIIMIGGIYPHIEYNRIIKASKSSIEYAADALQKSILCGLGYHSTSAILINLPYIGAYPTNYREISIRNYDFIYESRLGNITATNVGFCNLVGYKHISRYNKLKHTLKKILTDSEDYTTLLVYALTPSLLKACCDVKKYFKKVKVAVIVPDLPEYMSDNQSLMYRTQKRISDIIITKCYKDIDSWILLSKYMTERLPVKNNNWMVMEGIYNNILDDSHDVSTTSERYILYSGTLAKRYGVQTLVKAFLKSNLPNIKLYICGSGDSMDMIESIAKKNNRIVYLGQLKRDQVLKIQRGATLLVNPRTPEGEFTKYSFPSKTMEYLASGVPTLMYKLPGIPEEYYNYCYTIDDVSTETLTNALENIFKQNKETINEMGLNARKFILENKNPIIQMKKMVSFLENQVQVKK